MAGPVHYELYIRKTPPAPWSLMMATEDRKNALDTAEEILREQRAVAVRVTKETLDPDTMEFASTTVLTKGAPEAPRKRLVNPDEQRSNCNAPQDMYAPHARELLGRVLEDWLMRNGVTPFELLHRPDLVEKLEASGVEVQHAIQKVAIPESQGTGQPTHDLIRHYQRLTEQAMERVIGAGRRQLFPDLAHHSLADVAHRLAGSSERSFVMGGVVSGALIGVKGARARLDRIMDLADRAPMDGPPRALVMVALEQLLCELLGARTSLADILGPALDQGASLAAVVRMVAPREIEALIKHDPRMALLMPAVDGPAARLCENVTGAANKRSAARWLAACVTSLRFESEMRALGRTASQKLAGLAGLQRSVRASALAEHDETRITAAIGAVGGVVEAEAKLTSQLARAPVPVPQKLAALLRLAAGESAPTGPAADRAKAEALHLFRAPEARAALRANPEGLAALKGLMQAAGLAA